MAPIPDDRWPLILRGSPRSLMFIVGTWVVAAWLFFLLIDIAAVGPFEGLLPEPAWTYLFNDHPVEWAQWILLGLAVLAFGFLGGAVAATERHGAQSFCILLGLGLVVMLFEDAGDARHVISGHVRDLGGETIFGLPYRVVSDVPYFAAVAVLPVYAVLRYGRYVWLSIRTRPYLISAVCLYALAGGASGVRHLGGLYISIGAAVDRFIFAGRFPAASGVSSERTHFLLVDSVLEESIETMAAASMLAVALAYASDFRDGRLPAEPGRDLDAGASTKPEHRRDR